MIRCRHRFGPIKWQMSFDDMPLTFALTFVLDLIFRLGLVYCFYILEE